MQIKDIIGALTIIEEQVTIQPSADSNANKKNLKNPCKIHNGSHKWDDCHQNPKNAKSDGKHNKTGNSQSKNENNGRSREQSRTKGSSRQSRTPARSRSSSQARSSSNRESYEYNCINEKKSKQENKEQTASSEILVALPNTKNSKKYTTYLGLVDLGSSRSLLNSSIIENADFSVEKQKKPTKWDTATGVLLTKGKVFIEALSLPQFTRKHQVSTTFHLFEKRKDDKYDIIIGRDFLQAIGLDKYQVLPQGMKPATDIFQQCMNTLYHDMSNVDTFLDDSMLLGYRTFSVHLEMVIEVLSKWFQHCVTYLGFIITREGIKPQPDKIQGILNMKCPTSQKEVRCFVGMANF
jgi:hypothetical protein